MYRQAERPAIARIRRRPFLGHDTGEGVDGVFVLHASARLAQLDNWTEQGTIFFETYNYNDDLSKEKERDVCVGVGGGEKKRGNTVAITVLSILPLFRPPGRDRPRAIWVIGRIVR